MMVDEVEMLICWLQNAKVKRFQFTIEGEQEVCTPKYLLTRHRDMIIGALRDKYQPQEATQ